MNLLLYMSIIINNMSIIMILLSMIISKKSFMDKKKISSFECSFDPKSARLPSSLHFF